MSDILFWSLVAGAILAAGSCLAYLIGEASRLGGPEDDQEEILVVLPPGDYSDEELQKAIRRAHQSRQWKESR